MKPDVIVGCGDLPFEYLENLVSRFNGPLLYVPGNHDAALRPPDPDWVGLSGEGAGVGAAGCVNVDGRIEAAAGLWIAGLGGSIRYRPGPNQYTQRQMRFRALRLEIRARLMRRPVDVLISHSPPAGHGDADDPAHIGFSAYLRLIATLAPKVMFHGHVRHYGPKAADRRIGTTLIVNAIPYRLIEV
ncbi:MAG: hypothetical protein AUI15_17540 [Actinobacteria bacterium 13_2_20CM_2_66_6]|nr:MAG: hypothetical protein AUI15_17540 [Actinobacteria bacterium 13_2_20CM_2_66_6]